MVTQDLELQALLVSCRVDHDGAASGTELDDAPPHLLADPGRGHTDVDPRTDLEQPTCQIASEALRDHREDDDNHQSSS